MYITGKLRNILFYFFGIIFVLALVFIVYILGFQKNDTLSIVQPSVETNPHITSVILPMTSASG